MTRVSMELLIKESPFFIKDLCDKYEGFIPKSIYNYIHDYKRFKYFAKETIATGDRGHPPIQYTIDATLYRSDKNNEI